MPGRYRLLPWWSDLVIGAAFVVAILAGKRTVVLGLVALVAALEVGVLSRLLIDMSTRPAGISALALLSTAVGVWITNVVAFSLVYWELDRGSPRNDFSFPRGELSDGVPDDWQPAYADYLFLAYTTSTAFSPTDALPLTSRAKMLMMAQSLISLVTIVAVAARAINILGS